MDRYAVVSETISGSVATARRGGFTRLLDRLEPVDVLVVTKLGVEAMEVVHPGPRREVGVVKPTDPGRSTRMNIHKNARLTPQGRALLVSRVLDEGWRLADAAAAAGLSERRAHVWLGLGCLSALELKPPPSATSASGRASLSISTPRSSAASSGPVTASPATDATASGAQAAGVS